MAVARPTAVSYTASDIRLGTLRNVLGSDVDLGLQLIGRVQRLSDLGQLFRDSHRRDCANGSHRTDRVCRVYCCLPVPHSLAISRKRCILDRHSPVSGVLAVLIMVPAMLVGFDVIPNPQEIDLPADQLGKLLVISVFCAVAPVPIHYRIGRPCVDPATASRKRHGYRRCGYVS